ncbi:hypothetical protein BFP70_10910 [Thioclava sp. SK-1]|uniref:hypothetical protein n=1 Tax=Thioclava sp. SK-1 TaxID=1889770 RepID=UPI0008268E88|nr:hypothetical protein [Thioclava sp. SK-1]OCX64540.1 hypothetical protein BFP70_10910 [Thioclava sp. SK-1]
MTLTFKNQTLIVLTALIIGACSAGDVIDNTVDGTGAVLKAGAKGVVGAGRLAGQAVMGSEEEDE